MSSIINLASGDGTNFTLDSKAALGSRMIVGYVEGLMAQGVAMEGIVFQTLLKATTLEKIIAWLEHHKDDDIASQGEKDKNKVRVDEWDASFFKMDPQSMFDLANGAEYLIIPRLLVLTCMVLAGMIKRTKMEPLRIIGTTDYLPYILVPRTDEDRFDVKPNSSYNLVRATVHRV